MWFDILKLYPTGFEEKGGMNYSFTKDWLFVFNAHYMITLDTRGIPFRPITPSDINKLIIPKLPEETTTSETYWFYLNDDAKDFGYTIIDVLYSPEDIIKGTRGRLKVKDFKDENGKHRDKAIVFHHVNSRDRKTGKEHGYNAEYDILNVYYERGIKPNHREKRKSRERRKYGY